MLLNKSDITLIYPKVGSNISETEIKPSIDDAEIFDLQPILPTDMYDALKAQIPRPQIGWSGSKSYGGGEVVFHNEVFWKAVSSNTNSEPDSNNADWALAELLNLWMDYIRPFLVYKTLARFSIEHGRNITQFGIRTMNEDTSNDIGERGRAEMKANFDAKGNHYGQLLSKQFGITLTYDEVTYAYENCDTGKIKPKIKFWQPDSPPKRNEEWLYPL